MRTSRIESKTGSSDLTRPILGSERVLCLLVLSGTVILRELEGTGILFG